MERHRFLVGFRSCAMFSRPSSVARDRDMRITRAWLRRPSAAARAVPRDVLISHRPSPRTASRHRLSRVFANACAVLQRSGLKLMRGCCGSGRSGRYRPIHARSLPVGISDDSPRPSAYVAWEMPVSVRFCDDFRARSRIAAVARPGTPRDGSPWLGARASARARGPVLNVFVNERAILGDLLRDCATGE